MALATNAYATAHAASGLGAPAISQPLLEGPKQRGADHVVMRIRHAVVRVVPAKGCELWQDRLRAVESTDHDIQSLDELLALNRHVDMGEYRAQPGVGLEQAVIEHRRGLVGDRHNLVPAFSNEGLLSGCHGFSPVSFRSHSSRGAAGGAGGRPLPCRHRYQLCDIPKNE